MLTFTRDASLPTSSSDDWIFATSQTGDILDIKQFEAGETTVLKSDRVTSSDKVNITIFHYFQPNTETIEFTSYLSITPGQTWVVKREDSFSPSKIGTATFNITTAGSFVPLAINISTNTKSYVTRPSSPTSDVTIDLSKSPERIFATHTIGGIPSYFEANDIEDGDRITAAYTTDFKPLENLFNIELLVNESFYGSVSGISDIPGVDPFYIKGFLNYNGSNSSQQWGYNSGFDVYRTSMSKSSDKVSRQYFKLGSPVTNIPFPDNAVSIDNSGFVNPEFSFSGDYHLRSSRWTAFVADYNSVLSWRVYSPPGGKQVFSKIPNEIVDLYPSLSVESLAPKDNTFTIYLDGFSYSDFVISQMNIGSATKPYSAEYQTIIVQN
ncbi:MAG: hypothetical protein ACMVP2_25760 [Imperialibacter sp.]|uniref:hypothetical protein n=1 Tax=Imperialibacter sp. TaxID=2038411 RepID=UPI003A83FD27